MSLTVSQIYSVRFGNKLPLPGAVQDNIAKLRITAATYKPVRHNPKHHRPHKHEPLENWRMKSIVGYISLIKDTDDRDYHNIFAMLNKVSGSNLDQLSKEASDIIAKRDQEFRLRVSTAIFNKAINGSMFASVLADFVTKLNESNPEFREDLILQANMFPQLYDVNTTLTYPSPSEADYESKVEQWMKQKDKRRGYAKFLTQLFIRNLITEEIILASMENVVSELKAVSKQPRSEQTEENTTQFVDFIYESSKLLPVTSTKLRGFIKTSLSEILATPKTDSPSLGMRSRFRLEDTLKCVQ
jgi:hypothetical protein